LGRPASTGLASGVICRSSLTAAVTRRRSGLLSAATRPSGSSPVTGLSALPFAVTGLSSLARAMAHLLAAAMRHLPARAVVRRCRRCGLTATVIHRLAAAVIHPAALTSALGKRATEDVRMATQGEIHKDDEDRGARNRDRYVMEKEATPQVAASAKRLNRGGGVWLLNHVLFGLSSSAR
jgi:hypothetical protein